MHRLCGRLTGPCWAFVPIRVHAWGPFIGTVCWRTQVLLSELRVRDAPEGGGGGATPRSWTATTPPN